MRAKYGDYTFDEAPLSAAHPVGDEADYSQLGKPALFTLPQFLGYFVFALGFGAAVVCCLLVLFG